MNENKKLKVVKSLSWNTSCKKKKENKKPMNQKYRLFIEDCE